MAAAVVLYEGDDFLGGPIWVAYFVAGRQLSPMSIWTPLMKRSSLR